MTLPASINITPFMTAVQPTHVSMLSSMLCGVQPLASNVSSISNMTYNKENPMITRLKLIEKIVCDTVDVLRESWDEIFIEDKMICRPMIWCLRELAGLTDPEEDGSYRVPPKEAIEHIEDEYWTMMAWIVQNHNAITFDLEMRGLKTKRELDV